jgi:hypothetical protein
VIARAWLGGNAAAKAATGTSDSEPPTSEEIDHASVARIRTVKNCVLGIRA